MAADPCATPQASETRLAAEIERLRRDIEAVDGPVLPDAELRRRVDALADLFLALYPDEPSPGPPVNSGSA